MRSAICHSVAAVALTSALGCGGSDQNVPPQTAGQTTTTGAPTYIEPSVQPGAQGPAAPTTASGSVPTPGTESTRGLMVGTAGTSAGSPVTDPLTSGSAASPGSSTVSDEQIAAVLDAANAVAIEEGRLATKKAKDAGVRQFAEQMVNDHLRAEGTLKSLDTKDGLTPHEGLVSDQLKEASERVMISLRSGNAADFDRTYVEAQVNRYESVLGMIDRFIPQAQNADLKAQLQECRAKAAEHLRRAQELQSSLDK